MALALAVQVRKAAQLAVSRVWTSESGCETDSVLLGDALKCWPGARGEEPSKINPPVCLKLVYFSTSLVLVTVTQIKACHIGSDTVTADMSCCSNCYLWERLPLLAVRCGHHQIDNVTSRHVSSRPESWLQLWTFR